MRSVCRRLAIVFGVLVLIVSFGIWGHAEPADSLEVREVLSIKTGNLPGEIGNQLFHGKQVPVDNKIYAGFAVDSKGTMFVSDRIKSRVLRYSRSGKALAPLAAGKANPEACEFFWPSEICLDGNDRVYVHDLHEERIRTFEAKGEGRMRVYSPNFKAFDNIYRSVPIIGMACGEDSIRVAFGVRKARGKLEPVYEDTYNRQFGLAERKVFEDEGTYRKAKADAEPDPGFVVTFTDSKKNRYAYPLVSDPVADFLPLSKHSPDGTLLWTIDGAYLSRKTQYKVYDYFSLDNVKVGWTVAKGKEMLIVNWYVSGKGVVYVLLANNDYVKVLSLGGR
jgi:hypothetical protein